MTDPAPADVHALVGAYAVHALDDEERTDFEHHLASCPACQAELTSLREAASALSATTEVAPSAQLRARVLAGLADVPQEPAPAPQPDEATGRAGQAALPADVVVLPRRKVRFAVLGAAAAVLAAVGIGSTVVDSFQDDQVPRVAPTMAERIASADDAEEVVVELPDGGTATVVRSAELGRAMIVTENMPAPPPDSVYQLWFEDVEDGMVSAGVMPTASDQTFLLHGRAEDARAVGITVEPQGGSVRPTTTATVALFEFDSAPA